MTFIIINIKTDTQIICLYAILILFIYGTFSVLHLFLDFTLSIIFLLGIIYLFLRLICQALIYPGSFKLY